MSVWQINRTRHLPELETSLSLRLMIISDTLISPYPIMTASAAMHCPRSKTVVNLDRGAEGNDPVSRCQRKRSSSVGQGCFIAMAHAMQHSKCGRESIGRAPSQILDSWRNVKTQRLDCNACEHPERTGHVEGTPLKAVVAGSNPAESNHCGYGETGRRNGVIILDNKVTLWPTSVLALKYGRASSKLATHTNLPKVTRNEYKTVVYSGPNLPRPQPSCGSD